MTRLVCSIAALVSSTALIAGASSRTVDYDGGSISITADIVRNVTLPDGYFVTGTVRDSVGSPIFGALVSAVAVDGYSSTAGVSDMSGAFQIAVRASTHRIIVRPPESSSVDPSSFSPLVPSVKQNVVVSSDSTIGDIVLAAGYVVSGRVLPSSGSMTHLNGRILAIPQKQSVPLITGQLGSDPNSNQFAMAVPKGKFTLTFFGGQGFTRSGSSWSLLPMSSYTTSALNISKNLSRNIKVPNGYKLSGTARDTQQRALDGLLYCWPIGGDPTGDGKGTVIPVMNGKFVCYLPKGRCDLTLVPLMDRTYSGKAALTDIPLQMTAADKTLPITASDGIVLSGKVKVAAGAAAAGALIELAPLPVTNGWPPLLAMADSKGQYRVAVPSGSYQLHVWPGSAIGTGAASALPSAVARRLR